MPEALDPIKRLRTSLGLNQEPFGKLLGVSQNRVSEWESGAPLSVENAVQVWNRYGPRLRGVGCRLQDLLARRESPGAGDGEAGAA